MWTNIDGFLILTSYECDMSSGPMVSTAQMVGAIVVVSVTWVD